MSEARDPYLTLGVERTATPAEIKRAYRKLAKKWHPDTNAKNPEAEARFKTIATAYEVLSDPERRRLYDEFGDEALRSGFDADRARAARAWASQGRSSGGGIPFDLSDLDSFFNAGRKRRDVRGSDVRAVVELELIDALRGAELTTHVPGVEQPITVRIPRGTDDGTVLTVKGRGSPSPFGGEPGDLLIETRVRPHPHFERTGLDLRLRLPVTLDEAVNGATVSVPTPDGPVKLKIPRGSQNGATLRLRDKGVTRKDLTGDLYVELVVRLPDQPDEAFAAAARNANSGYLHPVRDDLRL
jgi:curved DNA-binding protein